MNVSRRELRDGEHSPQASAGNGAAGSSRSSVAQLSDHASPGLLATAPANSSVFHSARCSKQEVRIVTRDINVLALVKGQERYIFLFDDGNRSEALRTLGRFASNPELSFTWYDAAVHSQKIRRLSPAEPSRQSRFTLPLSSDNLEADEKL
jgi:hypothetical protein